MKSYAPETPEKESASNPEMSLPAPQFSPTANPLPPNDGGGDSLKGGGNPVPFQMKETGGGNDDKKTKKETEDDCITLDKSDLSSLLYIQSGGNLHVLAVRDVAQVVNPSMDKVTVSKDKLKVVVSEEGGGTIRNMQLVRSGDPYYATTFALYEKEDEAIFAGESLDYLVKIAEITSQGSLAGMVPGAWNPPGDMPIPFYIGNEAHEAIAYNYRKSHSGDTVFSNSDTVYKVLNRAAFMGKPINRAAISGTEGIQKPDITNLSLDDLFEIKPINQQAEAVSQLSRYLAIFQKAGLPIKPGTSTDSGVNGVLPGPAGFFQFFSPIPGVILYRYMKKNPELEPEKVPELVPEHKQEPEGFWEYMATVTGLSGVALVIYVIISEGSRIIPARNLIPVP